MNKIKKVTVHAGHNPSGKIACGASDLLDESTEARWITRKVVKLLKKNGIKAVNCTVNNGTSQSDVLRKICAKCNAVADADLHISIHLNSGRADKKGDGNILVEVCFVDDKDDYMLYRADRPDVARAIVKAVLNHNKAC